MLPYSFFIDSGAVMLAGVLSRGAYARAAAIRIGAFVAVTAIFPFLLSAIAFASNCANVGGACGALGVVVSLFAKPVIYFLFVLSFINITVRRLRDLRLPAVLAIILPVLMLGDTMFGITMGAPWGLGFALGSGTQGPRFLFEAIVCIGFLSLVPGADQSKEDRAERWGYAGAIALGILTLMCISAALMFMRDVSPWVAGVGGLNFSGEVTRIYGAYGIPTILVALLTFVAWRQRQFS